MYFVATGVDSGAPFYLSPNVLSWMDVLKASAVLPILYRYFVTIGGVTYTDGGVSDPLPAARAYELGAEKVVVIRSRPKNFRIRAKFDCYIAALRYRRHPELCAALLQHAEVYNRQVEFLAQRAAAGTLVSIAPLAHTAAGRTAISRTSIEHDYRCGRDAGASFLKTGHAELQ